MAKAAAVALSIMAAALVKTNLQRNESENI